MRGGRHDRWLAAMVLCGSLLAGIPAASAGEPGRATGLDAPTRALILRHGPWPAPWRPDPSNRVSGRPEAIALGRRLFFDAGLSPSGRVSCSSCHRPERAWSDGRPVGIGLAVGRRNTPSLLDVRHRRWFGWSGAGDSLWAQSIRPLLDTGEMGSSAAHIQAFIIADGDLARHYASVFQRQVGAIAAEAVLVDVAKALATYQETLVSGRTAFDDLRDALASGDAQPAASYPAAGLRGLVLFVGRAGCSRCHAGASFTDDSFHAGTVDGLEPVTGTVDRGRGEGLEQLAASRFNRAGAFNDAVERRFPWTAADLEPGAALLGAMRAPTLRNVARTGPYMHDGRLTSLDEVVRRHRSGEGKLAESDILDLVRFLETLNDRTPPRRD